MRLPTGIQDFTKLREENMVYVDKTMYMMPFIQGGVFFLSRPRRFGKSLLLSTLKAAFSGRKDLFKDLWLEDKFDFKPRPVIRIDFSLISFQDQSLQQGILEWLQIIAAEYNIELEGDTVPSAFRHLILECSKNGKVVILIDEYDKPITDYLLVPEKRAEHQAVLKSLYGVLKPLDAHLHLVFLTGVSKIGKLSLFSDLNNLSDISLYPDFVNICGYSRAEIELVFPSYLQAVAEHQGLSMPVLWDLMTFWYNGYSWDGQSKLYCPFSFLLFLGKREFGSFWYETGTPTFLLELIRAAKISPFELENAELDVRGISTTDVQNFDAIGLMFQTGYLTVQEKILGMGQTIYRLSYPNQEVRQAFSSSLVQEYGQFVPSQVSQFGVALYRALQRLDWEGLFAKLNQVFSSIPYEIFPKREAYAHSLLHLMLTSTGFRVQSQVQTALGRMDILLETDTHQIIFEVKTSGTAKEALAQVNTHKYADGLHLPVMKVGLVFELESKQIADWEIGS